MAKRDYNTIKITKNSQINIKLNRTGFEELTIAIDRVLSVRQLKPTDMDHKIQAVLMAQLKMIVLRRGLLRQDEYSITWSIAHALTFFVWTNPDEELMQACPNLRILNQNIYQKVI